MTRAAHITDQREFLLDANPDIFMERVLLHATNSVTVFYKDTALAGKV
ncbi:MAG: hypothetical protein GY696_29315 [Gammaproteobacteria bacterium]|nr:hypothetical protein [Gammaproteobacteria bacterium]